MMQKTDKRTSAADRQMSALGQKATLPKQGSMSALEFKADVGTRDDALMRKRIGKQVAAQNQSKQGRRRKENQTKSIQEQPVAIFGS
jgi:hypothetical protein